MHKTDEARRALANRIIAERDLATGRLGTALWLSYDDATTIAAALRADPARSAEETVTHLLREAEPTLSRSGDEIRLCCPDGTITDDLYDALEAAIRALPISQDDQGEGGADG